MKVYYLSTEELVSRGNAVFPHYILLPDTHLSFRYFNQVDIKASPCSSFCQDRFPEVNAVRQEARDCSVHTISSPSPLSSPLPCLAGLCCSPHLSSSHGWGAWVGPSVYTTEMSRSRETNQLGQRGPSASVILQQRPLLSALFNTLFNSARNISVKDTIDTSGQYAPRSLGLWVGLLCFICFWFLF